jgi:hypothetical protein
VLIAKLFTTTTHFIIWPRWHPPPPGTLTQLLSSSLTQRHLTQPTAPLPSISTSMNINYFFHNISNTITIYICLYTIREAAVGVLTIPNLYLFHYFLWEYHFWFMPTFSGTQLGHKTRPWCICNSWWMYTKKDLLTCYCEEWTLVCWDLATCINVWA